MKTDMKKGGMPMVTKNGKKIPTFAAKAGGMPPALAKHAAKKAGDAHAGLKSGGMAKGYAKGGGVESKGKTKGTMIAMKKGGKC